MFAYVTDLSRFAEWQAGVVGGSMEGGGHPEVGAKCMTTRRIGFAERPVTSEITAIAPPKTWSVHGIDGPIRAAVNVTVDPLGDGARSGVAIEIDFGGRGIGKPLVPLLVRRARNEMPKNLRRLKDRLESDQSRTTSS